MVEGIWKQYEFKIGTEEDHKQISQFLSKYYYRDEPITTMLGWSAKKERDVDSVVRQFLHDRLSLYALDRETQEVVAVRIAYDSRRKVNLTEVFQSEDNLKVQILKDQLVHLGTETLRQEYPEEVYAMGFLSSVSTLHRGQGLASEIYRRSVIQFIQRGFLLTRNFFSSKVTMKIVRRLGYQEISRIYLGQLRNPLNQELVFPQADQDFYATFMARRLDNEIV